MRDLSVRGWNTRFRGYLEEIAAAPREAVDLDDIADMLSCVMDGGIIMSRTLRDPRRVERQVLAFRSFVKMLFSPPVLATASPPAAVASP